MCLGVRRVSKIRVDVRGRVDEQVEKEILRPPTGVYPRVRKVPQHATRRFPLQMVPRAVRPGHRPVGNRHVARDGVAVAPRVEKRAPVSDAELVERPSIGERIHARHDRVDAF